MNRCNASERPSGDRCCRDRRRGAEPRKAHATVAVAVRTAHAAPHEEPVTSPSADGAVPRKGVVVSDDPPFMIEGGYYTGLPGPGDHFAAGPRSGRLVELPRRRREPTP